MDSQELYALHHLPMYVERSVFSPPGPPEVYYDDLGLAAVQNKVVPDAPLLQQLPNTNFIPKFSSGLFIYFIYLEVKKDNGQHFLLSFFPNIFELLSSLKHLYGFSSNPLE